MRRSADGARPARCGPCSDRPAARGIGDPPLEFSGDVPLDESGALKVSPASYEYTRPYWNQIGATVVGRHVFDMTDGWDGQPGVFTTDPFTGTTPAAAGATGLSFIGGAPRLRPGNNRLYVVAGLGTAASTT